MINVQDARSSRYKCSRYLFRREETLCPMSWQSDAWGLVRSDKKRKIVSSKKQRGSMKNRMEIKRSKKSDRRTSQVRGSMATVGRVVHRVHGIQVGVACAIPWCASVRSIGAEMLHVPRRSRSCSWQAVGTLGVAHGWVRVCSNRCVGLGGCSHGSEVRGRRHVGDGVISLRVGLDGNSGVGVSSTSVGD